MPDPLVEPSKTAPGGKEPVKDPVTDPVKEPGKVEPGKTEPGKVEPAKVEPGKEPPDPLAVKLEGDKVPEKFRGKTMGEVLGLQGTTDANLTKAEQENAQWRAYFQLEKEKAAKPKEKEFNPLDHLEEKQAQAVLSIVDARNKPILDGLSSMMLEYAKSIRPDFKQFEVRSKQIYDSLLPEYKYHPDYGWDFAYRFAKAEAEGTPAPPSPAPPQLGPSATGTGPAPAKGLTDDQKLWAKRMGLTDEEFTKFQKPIDAAKLEETGKGGI